MVPFSDFAAQLRSELPLNYASLDLSSSQRVGLVIIDEVNGFCTVGAGNLAPRVPSKSISDMVVETNIIAKKFSERGWPILAFLDTHEPDKPEVPYPPHCIVGTGEENLVSDLAWLEQDEHTLVKRKDCIDAFIGAFEKDGTNVVVEWIKKHQIEMILVVGICTDICVMDFVKTVLSARNHDMLNPLKHVAVYSEGCATYDLPVQVARDTGGIAHPQEIFHHLGLYLVAARGAIVVNTLHFMDEPVGGGV
ncbi:hypothetical protein MPTK1_2g26560 [Marchantia polymorpha subsp. ruderalis]|uniref:Isochorismatase-like domain-containing protein n=1 Tax=Marchantia polymorpha TaxID=3197 RepID=A0A2R6XB44_MARPO|nr:hypothetical protein MARPO_0025s0028 [Marchantia polymorpha]BBN03810.1 hypothetical protein Mp_2g26560 [Marchantia polymorpha subsp. ruderalis]|eukprot:PTQ43325.1 hypothetical protein MARPO_0025s0028 [Marchantia polymorpha]